MSLGVCGECHSVVPLTHWAAHLNHHKQMMKAIMINALDSFGRLLYTNAEAEEKASSLAMSISILPYG